MMPRRSGGGGGGVTALRQVGNNNSIKDDDGDFVDDSAFFKIPTSSMASASGSQQYIDKKQQQQQLQEQHPRQQQPQRLPLTSASADVTKASLKQSKHHEESEEPPLAAHRLRLSTTKKFYGRTKELRQLINLYKRNMSTSSTTASNNQHEGSSSEYLEYEDLAGHSFHSDRIHDDEEDEEDSSSDDDSSSTTSSSSSLSSSSLALSDIPSQQDDVKINKKKNQLNGGTKYGKQILSKGSHDKKNANDDIIVLDKSLLLKKKTTKKEKKRDQQQAQQRPQQLPPNGNSNSNDNMGRRAFLQDMQQQRQQEKQRQQQQLMVLEEEEEKQQQRLHDQQAQKQEQPPILKSVPLNSGSSSKLLVSVRSMSLSGHASAMSSNSCIGGGLGGTMYNCVLIGGQPGTGKSRLVHEMVNQLRQIQHDQEKQQKQQQTHLRHRHHGEQQQGSNHSKRRRRKPRSTTAATAATAEIKPFYFIKGKFDQQHSQSQQRRGSNSAAAATHQQPLSALIQAFTDFISQVLADYDEEEQHRIQISLMDEFLNSDANDKNENNNKNKNSNSSGVPSSSMGGTRENLNVILNILPGLDKLLYGASHYKAVRQKQRLEEEEEERRRLQRQRQQQQQKNLPKRRFGRRSSNDSAGAGGGNGGGHSSSFLLGSTFKSMRKRRGSNSYDPNHDSASSFGATCDDPLSSSYGDYLGHANTENDRGHGGSNRNNNNSRNLHRLKYCFQMFIRAICSTDKPIILFLDDLQWADPLSFELLTTIISMHDEEQDDNNNTNHSSMELLGNRSINNIMNNIANGNLTNKRLFFVGSYRNNEIDGNNAQHPFNVWRSQFITGSDNTIPRIQHMALENHSKLDIQNIIADTLRYEPDDESIQEITSVIYEKTHGNAFAVTQALLELERKKIIKFCFLDMKFTWDDSNNYELLRDSTTISDNVVSAIVGKLQTLHPSLQKMLTIASYLRSRFTPIDLQIFLKDDTTNEAVALLDLSRLLDIAVKEGLLEEYSTNKVSRGSSNGEDSKSFYRFSHDKIQEAAQSQGDRNMLRWRVGKYLAHKVLSSQSSPPSSSEPDAVDGEDGPAEWMWFVAADHLNAIPDVHDVHPLDLAKLNLEVGKKAIAVAAFPAASNYLLRGIEALERVSAAMEHPTDKSDGDPWELYYDISYELYKSSAEVHLVIGEYDNCHLHCEEIFKHARTLHEMVPAYLSMEGSLGRQQRHTEALQLTKDAARQFGVYPKSNSKMPLSILVGKDGNLVRGLFRQFTDEDIVNFPIMTDKVQLSIMQVLSSVSVRASLLNEDKIDALVTLRRIIHTFKYGLSGDGAFAMATYALMLCGPMGERQLGQRIGGLAKKVRRICNARHIESKMDMIAGYYVEPWSTPLTQVLKTFEEGYQAGMEMGDVEFAGWNWVCSNVIAYLSGFPLGTILDTAYILLEHVKQYNVDGAIATAIPMVDHFEYLMGTKRPDWKQLGDMDGFALSENDGMAMTHGLLSRAFLAYLMGKFSIAEQALEKYDTSKHTGGANLTYYAISTSMFLSGLLYSALGRMTGKRKYKRMAKDSLEKLKASVKRGALNDLHKLYIVEAEFAASFKPKHQEFIKKRFDLAIAVASKAGFVNDSALANELAGENFLRSGDDHWSSFYFSRALSLYKEWGAQAKAEQLVNAKGDSVVFETNEARSQQPGVLSERYKTWTSSRSLMSSSVDLSELSG